MPFINAVSKKAFTRGKLSSEDLGEMKKVKRTRYWSLYSEEREPLEFYIVANIPEKDGKYWQIGHVALEKKRFKGDIVYRIANIGIHSKYQGMGLGVKLYTAFADMGMPIMSGDSQSPGAIKLWSKLVELPKYRVLMSNERGSYKWIDGDLEDYLKKENRVFVLYPTK